MVQYSAKIVLRTDAVRVDGRAALGLQVIIRRKKKVFPLHIYIRPSEFDKAGPSVRLKEDGAEWRQLQDKYNAILLSKLGQAMNIIAEAHYRSMELDMASFSAMFTEEKVDDFFSFVRAQIEKERGVLALGTTKDQEKTLRRLERWRKSLPFSELNLDAVKSLHMHLRKTLNPNTIASTHKSVRKFVLAAQQKYPWLPNPYEKFKIKWADTERIFLTPTQLASLLAAYQDGSMDRSMRRTARCFLFQSFTGLRLGDAKAIGEENIVGDRLVFTMEKTKSIKLMRRMKLNAIAMRLVEEARKDPGKKTWSFLGFPPADQAYNSSLKSLFAWMGQEEYENMSSHVGRHTFATNYLLAGGKVERLMKLLGHSSIETTMIYVHLVEAYADRDMDQYAAAFDMQGVVAA